jgi:hypothetical protein
MPGGRWPEETSRATTLRFDPLINFFIFSVKSVFFTVKSVAENSLSLYFKMAYSSRLMAQSCFDRLDWNMFGSVWIAFGCVWMLFGCVWIYFGLLWMRLDYNRIADH